MNERYEPELLAWLSRVQEEREMIDFLFVCSQNVWRSPTAEHVARLMKFDADSAGTDLGAVRPLTPAAIARAKRLVAMEEKHAKALARMAPGRVQDIECWGIPDQGPYCAPYLIKKIKDKLRTPKNELLWRPDHVDRKGP